MTARPHACMTARPHDCMTSWMWSRLPAFAAGYSDEIKDELMAHAPVHKMAAHYKGVIDKERLFKIKSCLL